MRNKTIAFFLFLPFFTLPALGQVAPNTASLLPVRTITAGVTLKDPEDTAKILQAIAFLKQAASEFQAAGYVVQTLRIATNNFPVFAGKRSFASTLPALRKIDSIARANKVIVSIGQILQGDECPAGIEQWALSLIQSTTNISLSAPISSHALGIHKNSIRAAAAIIVAISKGTEGGEGNFRFTASANCPAGIPFFPAAFHEGPNSFAIGMQSPTLITEVFKHTTPANAKKDLTAAFESALLPVQELAEKIAAKAAGTSAAWTYDGIDDSPAPGLDASIGLAIETYTGQPFGSPSTLSACALITDVLKGLSIRKCGYSGLMLPVIEDKVLAQRAGERRFTMQELLLFSSVSGTGLDVVPLPGDTPASAIENILTDIAALSLKYTAKALSGRLFLIPGHAAGDMVEFKNSNLVPSVVMKMD